MAPHNKPTAIKRLEGFRAHRPHNENEPQPDPAAPSCPTWLCPHAKSEWRRIVPQLHAMGVLTKIDRTMLETYCETYAKFNLRRSFYTSMALPTNSQSEMRMARSFPSLSSSGRR